MGILTLQLALVKVATGSKKLEEGIKFWMAKKKFTRLLPLTVIRKTSCIHKPIISFFNYPGLPLYDLYLDKPQRNLSQ